MGVKFGIVGTGRVAKNHLAAIKKNKDCLLQGVYDIKKNKAVNFIGSEHFVYDTLQDLLATGVDVINVCTPPSTHYEIAKQVLKAKKNLILEKPITLDVTEANRLVKLAKENRVKFTVCHQNRFNYPLQYLKGNLRKLGNPLELDAAIRWNRDDSYYQQEEWYHTNPGKGFLGKGGGTLMNQGIHTIDLLLWLNGRVKNVTAVGGALNHNILVDDCIKAVLVFENNSIGTLSVSTCTQPRNFESTIFFNGTKGSCEIGGVAVNKFTRWKINGEPDENEKQFLKKQNPQNPPTVYGFGHEGVINDMVRVCNKKRSKPYISAASATEALKVTLAIYESIKQNGKVIQVDNRENKTC